MSLYGEEEPTINNDVPKENITTYFMHCLKEAYEVILGDFDYFIILFIEAPNEVVSYDFSNVNLVKDTDFLAL
jgi:hypothetical protein